MAVGVTSANAESTRERDPLKQQLQEGDDLSVRDQPLTAHTPQIEIGRCSREKRRQQCVLCSDD
eukprot:4852757-Pleurochrysis_carterae.AAC.2